MSVNVVIRHLPQQAVKRSDAPADHKVSVNAVIRHLPQQAVK